MATVMIYMTMIQKLKFEHVIMIQTFHQSKLRRWKLAVIAILFEP